MSDGPPPRKKSRFFSNGKSKIGDIPASSSGEARTDEDLTENDDILPAADNRLSTNHHPDLSSQQEYPTPSASSFTSQSQSRSFNPPQNGYGQVSAHTNATGSGSEMDVEPSGVNDEQNADIPDKATKKKRRAGIYGVESLLPPNGGTSADAENIAALGPPGNNYLFGGVPTYPHVQPAGGHHPFGFRNHQRISSSAEEIPAGNTQQQAPIGSGRRSGSGPQVNPMDQNTSYVDMDRDERGRPAPLTAGYGKFRPTPHHGIYPRPRDRPFPPLRPMPLASDQVPAHLSNPDSLVPENMYMSPNRIAHAKHHAMISLKRKRPETILPPPSYVYQRTGDPNFNIFQGMLLYPELVFALSTQLPVRDLLSLYSISRDFHVMLDARFTTVMLSQARAKAPESAQIYHFRSYAHLCRKDPAARIPHPNARMAAKQVARRIPSFRWLRMVLHREKVVHEMMAVFAEGGVPLPMRCSLALKRLWFIMDIPDNARRIGAVHNRRLLTDMDVYFGNCFVTKLDMLVNDPVEEEKRDGLRKLLLGQRSLTTMVRVLKRDLWTSRLEVMREWVRYKYEPADDERGHPIFGIATNRIGRGCLEYWGRATATQLGREPQKLLRPDQLLVREAYRRGMRLEKHFLRFLLYGYVRPDTLTNFAPRTYGRRIDALKDDEYEIDDVIGGVAALGVNDEGYDELLDLGPPREGSIYTIVKEGTSTAEKNLRARDAVFTKMCMEWWERETREMQRELEMDVHERMEWLGQFEPLPPPLGYDESSITSDEDEDEIESR